LHSESHHPHFRPTRNSSIFTCTFIIYSQMKNGRRNPPRSEGHGRLIARWGSLHSNSSDAASNSSAPSKRELEVIKPAVTSVPSSSHVAVGATSTPNKPPPRATAKATPSQPPPGPKAPATPKTDRAKPTVAKTSSNSFVGRTLTPLPTATPASSSPSHTSGIAIGLVLGLIGVAAMVIGAVWIVRRRRTKEVGASGGRWKRELFPNPESPGNGFIRPEVKSEGYLRLGDEKMLPVPGNESPSIQRDVHSSFLRQSMAIAPPSSTYNNPIRPVSTVPSLTPNAVDKAQELAKVQRGFLPTLPDELQIQQGEMIEILKSFDDGWALCLNQTGEKGVVPIECLSRHRNMHGLEVQDRLGVQEGGEKSQSRLSKRASSLYAEATY